MEGSGSEGPQDVPNHELITAPRGMRRSDWLRLGRVLCQTKRLREGEARIPREKSVAVALSKGNRWVGDGGNNIYPL